MSELNRMGCAEFADVAAELALGVLTGRERAAAIAHMETCDACREHVRQLTMTGEALVGLLPTREPPAGFESRVMERIGLAPAPAPAPAPAGRVSWISRLAHPARPPARPAAGSLAAAGPAVSSQAVPGPAAASRKHLAGRTRRMLAVAAVALAVVAGGLGGWGLRNATPSPATTQLASARLLSASHQTVGKIFLYQGSPRWVYMSVDMHAGNGTVICQVRGQGGRFTTVGSFRLSRGYGSWGSPAPAAPGPLTGARLVTTGGRVLATASFRTA